MDGAPDDAGFRKAAEVVERCVRRMLIESGVAENVDFLHVDAPSSTLAIRVG